LLGNEVVDLARTDLVAAELPALFEALPALQPDAVVLFAGNNWHSVVFELDELQRLADAIRAEGYAGYRRVFIDDILVPRCRSILDSLAASTKEFGIRVVLVVPEFNLADWRGEPGVLAPVLPGAGNVRWMEARGEALDALTSRDFERAAGLAARMIALDGGTSSVSQRLVAEASTGLGRRDEARRALEAARDSVCGLGIGHSPRCPTAVQDELRRAAARHGFTLVDLPRIFEQHLSRELPGRRLFLDYCHLTVEGMRVAMTAVAQQAATLLARDAPLSEFQVAPEDEAMAHFLAAVHNTHYGQDASIIRHHCRRATELSASVGERMRIYLDFASRRADPWLCESFDRICESRAAARYLSAFDPQRTERLADFQLLEVIAETLEEGGISTSARLRTMLIEEHGSVSGNVDLLEPCYRARSFRERAGYSLGPERAFYRALDTTSAFYLVRDATQPVRLQLTCRVPSAGEARADVAVSVNGSSVGVFNVGASWQTFELTIPAAVVREGVNVVEIDWPLLGPAWQDELERGARRLERGVYPDVLPAWGEIHRFTASSPLR